VQGGKLKNGIGLWKDGKAAASDKCCCGECPNCPPLDQMPTICNVKITPQNPTKLNLIDDDPWTWWMAEYGPTSLRGRWVKANDEGGCWYRYSVKLNQACCVWRCRDDDDIPIQPGFQPLSCSEVYRFPCEVEGEYLGEWDHTFTITMDGFVRVALMELLSSTEMELEFRYNCQTGVLERRVHVFHFIYDQDLQGRFMGKRTEKWVSEANTPQACKLDSEVVTWINRQPDGTPITYGCSLCGNCEEQENHPEDTTDACSVMPIRVMRDTDPQLSYTYYCWRFLSWMCHQNYAYRSENHILYEGDWETIPAVDAPLTFTPKFSSDDNSGSPFVEHQCYGEEMTAHFIVPTWETFRWYPPQVWGDGGGPFYECLECENDSEEECLPPPIHETCSATENPPGLEVQVHSPGADWDEIRMEFTLNTSQSNDSCPELLYDPLTCQPKDETDEYPGT
jgi:hypothetical protein